MTTRTGNPTSDRSIDDPAGFPPAGQARRSGCRWALPVLALLATAVVSPDALGAQLIRGTVTDPATGVPVQGALVRIVGVAPRPHTSFLTGTDGRYQVRVDSGGYYALSVERIGYESVTLGPFSVESPGVTTRDIQTAQRAITLEGLVVESDRRTCDLGRGDAGVTQSVWDQVRTALSAARWTRGQRGLSFRINERQRRLDAENGTVLELAERTVPSLARNSVRALPAEELARDGYVRTMDSGELEYYGPDAEILLSDDFLDHHCFYLRDGEDEDDDLGLAFEPAELLPERTDIQGTLWLDRQTARLERITFRYVGLPFDVDESLAGGEVVYLELPTGRWIVRDWSIRAPAVQVLRGSRQELDRFRVEEIYETAASVVRLRDGDFEWSPDQPTYLLVGRAVDSTRANAPLAGARISVAGRGWRTTSDSEGRFEIEDLLPGRYRVVLEHPRLDSLGLAPIQRDAEVGPGSFGTDFAVPSFPAIMASRCGVEGAVVGRVVTESGEAPPLPVRVTATNAAGGSVATVDSGYEGWWSLCQLPREEMRIRAELSLAASRYAAVTVPDSGFAQVRLTLPDLQSAVTARGGGPGEAASGDDRGSRITLTGVIRDASSATPIASAAVDLVDADGEVLASALSDEAGRYTVSVLTRLEEVTLQAQSLGYGQLSTDPLAVGRRSYQVDVDLAPEALELEGVVVSVEATNPILTDVGFYQRERSLTGDFFDKVDLELPRYTRTSDALMRLPSFRIVDTSSFSGATTRQFVQYRRPGTQYNICLPAIYLDGAAVRQAFAVNESGGTAAGAGVSADDLATYPTVDEIIRAYDIEAIELYDGPSAGSAQYVPSQPPCGSIVIWTIR